MKEKIRTSGIMIEKERLFEIMRGDAQDRHYEWTRKNIGVCATLGVPNVSADIGYQIDELSIPLQTHCDESGLVSTFDNDTHTDSFRAYFENALEKQNQEPNIDLNYSPRTPLDEIFKDF